MKKLHVSHAHGIEGIVFFPSLFCRLTFEFYFSRYIGRGLSVSLFASLRGIAPLWTHNQHVLLLCASGVWRAWISFNLRFCVSISRVLVVPFAPCGLICNSLQDSSSPAFLGCGCAVHKSKSAFICKCGSRFCVVDASFLDELCWVVHASVGCLGRQWNWLLVAQRQIWWVVWQDHRHVFHWHLVPEPSI